MGKDKRQQKEHVRSPQTHASLLIALYNHVDMTSVTPIQKPHVLKYVMVETIKLYRNVHIYKDISILIYENQFLTKRKRTTINT